MDPEDGLATHAKSTSKSRDSDMAMALAIIGLEIGLPGMSIDALRAAMKPHSCSACGALCVAEGGVAPPQRTSSEPTGGPLTKVKKSCAWCLIIIVLHHLFNFVEKHRGTLLTRNRLTKDLASGLCLGPYGDPGWGPAFL
jgi:hypothetical protein